jgi:hypothetical protein
MVDLKQLQALANNAKVELEMSNGTLGMIVLMGIFYIAITGVGVNTFGKCSKIQDSQKWKNLKGFLSHTMTMAITTIATLVFAKFAKSEAAVFGVLFGIFGTIASSMTLAMTNECKDTADKAARNFGIVSLIGYLMLMIGSILMMLRSRGKLPSLKKSGGTPTVARQNGYVPLSQNIPITSNSMKME